MLILLPPSEGKASTDAGRPFDLDALSMPELNATRRRVLAALVKLAGGRESRAREAMDQLNAPFAVLLPPGLMAATAPARR